MHLWFQCHHEIRQDQKFWVVEIAGAINPPTPHHSISLKPINHQAYRPSSLSTIEPINHRAHQPSSLSTSGFLLRLLSLLACSIFINLFIFCCCFKHFCTIGYQAFIFLKFKNWNTLYWSILKKLGHLKFLVQFFTLRQTE